MDRSLAWLLTLFGVLTAAGVVWVGSSMVALQAKVAAIDTKVDLLIEGHIK
jgi:hypothetical protein